MEEYDKLLLVADMLEEAILIFNSASKNVDYIQCILLSGACMGISGPLLNEEGNKNAYQKSADITALLHDFTLSRLGLESSKDEIKENYKGYLNIQKMVVTLVY